MRVSAIFWPAVFAVPLAAALPHSAQAARTIDFNGNTGCQTDTTTYCRLPQTYGDSAEVDVSYASVHKGTSERTQMVYRYGTGFGDLIGVVFGRPNRVDFATEITLAAAKGFELSLLDFDFATFAGRTPVAPFRLTDLAGNVITEGMRSTGTFNGHSSYAVNSAFGSGVVIRWGPDSHEVALDNIRYEVRAIASAVPEPASWTLMIIGFGLIGAGLRRTRFALSPLAA